MSGKSIRDILKDFGLADNQAKIYILLAKQGILKGGEIAKQTKIPKAVVYRTIKVLQRKGFVESTLEFPARYVAVPFETVLDLNIKAKKEEALQIEKSKEDLLNDWKNISKGKTESSIEKFTVIDGDRKIFAKIYQMIKQTKKQLIAASTISDLFRADRYGVFDAVYDNPLKSKVKFRFLTDLTDSDLTTTKLFKNRLRSDLDFRGRNPELGLSLFPRMVIRDNEEILLFISDKDNKNSLSDKQTCLCTNCKSILKSFSGVFEDLWQNSMDIEQKIKEIETGKTAQKTQIIKNSTVAKTQYFEKLSSAKKEIEIITSANGLNKLSKNKMQFKNWNKKNVSIKVMAPVISENLDAAKQILRWGEVKHIPLGYFETTIIDNKHLFQFKKQTENQKKNIKEQNFENTFYTNDSEYIQQTKEMVQNIWKNTRIPSATTLESILRPSITNNQKESIQDVLKKISIYKSAQHKLIDKKTFLNKYNNEKSHYLFKLSYDMPDITRYFGSVAFGAIHLPKHIDLPDFIVSICKFNKRSTFGEENHMLLFLENVFEGKSLYEPVAIIQNNPFAMKYREKLYKNTPAGKNVLLFNKDEIQIQVKNNALFAGWTKPIPLVQGKYVLPPSCILFEGFGAEKSGVFYNEITPDRNHELMYNTIAAFVTYFHPSSKYSGPGTEGFIDKQMMLTSTKPIEK